MTFFTLLIIVVAGSTDGGVAVTSVGRYQTKELCEQAKAMVPSPPVRPYVYASCVLAQ